MADKEHVVATISWQGLALLLLILTLVLLDMYICFSNKGKTKYNSTEI